MSLEVRGTHAVPAEVPLQLPRIQAIRMLVSLVLRIPGRGFYLEQLGGMTFGVPAKHQNQLVSASRWRVATMLA